MAQKYIQVCGPQIKGEGQNIHVFKLLFVTIMHIMLTLDYNTQCLGFIRVDCMAADGDHTPGYDETRNRGESALMLPRLDHCW